VGGDGRPRVAAAHGRGAVVGSRRGIINVRYYRNDAEGRARARGTVRYLLEESEAARGAGGLTAWTSAGDELDRRALDDWMRREQGAHTYTYTLVISPAPGETEAWTEEDWRRHTEDLMQEIEARHPEASWAAVWHDDPEHPHVHVLLEVDRTLRRGELRELNAAADRSVEKINDREAGLEAFLEIDASRGAEEEQGL